MNRGPLRIIACESGRPFASKVYEHLRSKAGNEHDKATIRFVAIREQHFQNSEIKTRIEESIRGGDVFIFQDTENSVSGLSVDQNLRALTTMIDAAKRADAGRITAVLPSFPYARQDKAIGREAITAARVAQELELFGATSIISLDIHNVAICGFFRQAILENLHASKNILDYVRENLDCSNLVVASADEGGVLRAGSFAEALRKRLVICYKCRDYSRPNSVRGVRVLGSVRGRDVLVVEDMIDTAGTVESVCGALKKAGARKVYISCSLPLFNGRALRILEGLHRRRQLSLVLGTDAVYHGEDFEERHRWFRTVSVVTYFAKVISNINKCRSISALLE